MRYVPPVFACGSHHLTDLISAGLLVVRERNLKRTYLGQYLRLMNMSDKRRPNTATVPGYLKSHYFKGLKAMSGIIRFTLKKLFEARAKL